MIEVNPQTDNSSGMALTDLGKKLAGKNGAQERDEILNRLSEEEANTKRQLTASAQQHTKTDADILTSRLKALESAQAVVRSIDIFHNASEA